MFTTKPRRSPAQRRQLAMAQSMRALSGAVGTLQAAASMLRKEIHLCELMTGDIRLEFLKMQLQELESTVRELQTAYSYAQRNNKVIKEINAAERKPKKKLSRLPPDQD